MRDTPLTRLVQCGQSVWLDSLNRSQLVSGQLVSLIQEDGVSGVVFNPSLFECGVAAGTDYDAEIAALARQGMGTSEIYERLVLGDVRLAADLLRPLYDRLEGSDGFVSLGISPHLAHDASGTLLEARRLWELVDRPNLLVNIPATSAGVTALRRLVREGVNVNVTMVFGIPRYRAVLEAYLDGLSERAARGLPLERVASVAGILVGRIDLHVDPLLARPPRPGAVQERVAAALKGEVAIACAKAARCVNREIHADDRFLALSARGARPQRLLWGAEVRDPSWDRLRYAEALIGSDTVTAMPLETLLAYRDRGTPANRLDQGMTEALGVLERLHELGIDLEHLARELEDEGVERFARPYDSLLRNIELKRMAAKA